MDSCDIVPTEDVVQALMDYLVDPLLPSKSSARNIPSLSQQQSVAKQMRAVVLLYNYYHRKQYPQLEFLGFESFCKVAVNTKPSLLAYMKLMQRCNSAELDDLDKQLSITEKVIMDACDISISLDASKDVPSTKEWPVSKVSVFLIDSMKKNCLLLFSSTTQGVWSLIDKDLDDPNFNTEGMLEPKITNKKKRITKRPLGDELNAFEAVFQQLAFSAVKETTGINQTDLVVLESHVVYSLSKQKTAARFYLMQCTKSINEDVIQVPINDVIDSLQGPLVTKSFSNWTVTSVVEYFHVLPYAGIVSDWLSREGLSNSLQVLREVPGNVDANCSPRTEKPCATEVNKTCDRSQVTSQMTDILDGKASDPITDTLSQRENGEYCMGGSSDDLCSPQNMVEDYSSTVCPLSEDISKNIQDTVQVNHLEERMTSSTDSFLTAPKSGIKVEAEMVDSVMKPCSNECIDAKIAGGNDSCNFGSSGQEGMPTGDQVDSVMKPCSNECIGAKIASGNDSYTIGSSGQDGMPTGDHPLTPFKSNSRNLEEIQVIVASKGNELLQTAVRVLLEKRDKLTRQQRDTEDEIARCDKNLKAILSGAEDDLVLKIIIEGCNDACSRGATQTQIGAYLHFEEWLSPQIVKRKRLSEAILILRNPCQELDDTCYENNWILPRYNVFPSNGGFQATIAMQGMDFECSAAGDTQADPREARESAAEQMLSKLRKMVSQAKAVPAIQGPALS